MSIYQSLRSHVPLLTFSRGVGSNILRALAEELATQGFRPKDPKEGTVPVLTEALSDARAIRDRLLALVEKTAHGT